MNENIYIKHNVSLHEYNMHTYIYNLGLLNVPKIINYNPKNKIMVMNKINHMNISDYYGDNILSVPNNIISTIRQIIKTLKNNHIIYPDITGYNFIEYQNKIWIIDFEHSYFDFNNGTINKNEFVDDFINGSIKEWNPDFK